mmetsp:Transcript_5330/g.6607  ORF Transcript_5330/g.6607 Transcript_5330/m.6607 type:complete len:321 (+) Transcript_5330:653-1615(+)
MTRHSCFSPRRSSTIMSKVAGPARCALIFWKPPPPCFLPSFAAAASPSVVLSTPPTRLRICLFFTSFLRSPCAEAIIRTPRCLHVRAASTSEERPISSITITSGVWFWTHSTMTPAWASSDGTIIRRARPMQGCGTSPSPAISLLVSTMQTLLSMASSRVASRTMVVFPLPGSPRNRMLRSSPNSRSEIMSALPLTCLPTRIVRPITSPLRFLMPEIRCSCCSNPARLSLPKPPSLSSTASMSPIPITRSLAPRRTRSPAIHAHAGRPLSSTMSDRRSVKSLSSVPPASPFLCRSSSAMSLGNKSKSTPVSLLTTSGPGT